MRDDNSNISSLESVQNLLSRRSEDRLEHGFRLPFNMRRMPDFMSSTYILIVLHSDVPALSPRALCEAGNLGNLEANVMAGRALLGILQLPDNQQRCVIALVHEKVMSSGTSKNPVQRALKRIAPKLLELVIVSLPIARTFCGRLFGPAS